MRIQGRRHQLSEFALMRILLTWRTGDEKYTCTSNNLKLCLIVPFVTARHPSSIYAIVTNIIIFNVVTSHVM